MSDTPLAKKLLIKPGTRGLVVNAPPGYRALLDPLPDGVDLRELPELPAAPSGAAFDFALLFARNQADLERWGPALLAALRPDGVVWIAYPKQSARVATDITRDRGWDVITNTGWQGVSLVSVDDVWSAMRFRPRPPG